MLYKTRCRGCGCEFTFNPLNICKDEKEHDDWINCPECYLPNDALNYKIILIYES